MRYEPGTTDQTLPCATRQGAALYAPGGTNARVRRTEAMNRQAAELETWEDEADTAVGQAAEASGR